MVGIGVMELLCLLVFGVMFLGVVAAVIIFAITRNRTAAQPAPGAAFPVSKAAPPPPLPDYASQVEIVARLTQRFCPQCRSPLAPDSPEGLCPACLMAGAMGSEVVAEPANGLAATTPASGSKPPLDGVELAEIGDLQKHFPQLEILELLGRGGMGAVYKARQKNLDRIVALKVIPPEAAKDPTFAERFGREARALARLNHPNIVTVYDFGEIGDLHYLLMEYVDGVNLRQTLRAGRLAPREAVAIVPPICDALQYAHDQGVVHRDIKPENVLLDRTGRVKIADFGLAKLLGKGPDDFTLTRTQQVMGTPRYMAPEQIERPSTVDHRADIYSLGVVIYEMLTGELPIGRFEAPSQKVQVDVRIDQVVLRSLEKDPQRRYQRASEVKTELASATSWPTLAAPNLPAPAAAEGPGKGHLAADRPSWHTPLPAAKSGESAGRLPGGVPLGHVLMVAIGMVCGVLLMGGGLAAIIYGLIYSLRGAAAAGLVWAWWGSGFGCLVGGAGSVAGSYNTYRQLAGADDLMRSRRTTWLDWIMWGYLALGVLMLIPGIVELSTSTQQEHVLWPMLLLGGIAAAQALLFLVARSLYVLGMKTAASNEPTSPALATLQAPGTGLVVAGGLTIAASVLFLVSAIPILAYNPFSWHPGSVSAPMGMSITNIVPSLPVGILLILAGLSMRRGRSYSLAMVGCIAGLIPNGIAWPITFPLSLWALLTLRESRIQRVFQSSQDERESGDPSAVAADRSLGRQAGTSSVRSIPPAIRRRVMGPALGLIICGILLPFPNIALLVVSLDPREFRETMAGTAPFTGSALILAIIAAGLMVIGGTKLWNLDTYRLAWIGAVTALVPISPLWAFSLPIGLWALIVLLRADVQSWFDIETGEVPHPLATGERPEASPRSRFVSRGTSEVIRRRITGPAIGLMIVGLIGLLPCATMALALPAYFIFPARDVIQRGPMGTAAPGLAIALPLKATLQPPVLLAQYETHQPAMAEMAAAPMWGMLVMAGLTLFSLPLSLLMIIGGWRMRKLESYGLAVMAAIAALLPCNAGWILGLPIGIWALVTLLNSDVRAAFDQEPDQPDLPSGKSDLPHGSSAIPSNSGKYLVALGVVAGMLLLAAMIVVPLLIPATQAARVAARRARSMNNLRQIGLAMQSYYDVHGAFPPAVVTDAGGKPLYSGRVLLLPFLDQTPLYESFDLSKPWDSVENFAMSRVELPVFKDPNSEHSRPTTDYLFVTGAGTLFESGKAVKTVDCTDGVGNILALAEVRGTVINWAEPRDLNVSQPTAIPTGHYSGGNLALFADGSVQFLPAESLTPSQVRARATIAGGESLAVATDRFEALLSSLRRESFDSGKLSFVRGISPRTGLTSAQTSRLLKEFAFDSDRVEAAVALHPHVIDPENFFTVLESFTFDHDRQAVRQRLKLE